MSWHIRKIRVSPRTGQCCGETHPLARHPDSVVNEARAMFAAGRSFKEISVSLGVPTPTVKCWCLLLRRKPFAHKIITKRVWIDD